MTIQYQEKYLRAIEAKELLYASCRQLTDGHAPNETAAIRDAANAFFEIFISGTPEERSFGTDRGHDSLSAARKMADLVIKSLTLNRQLKDICAMQPGAVRCIMDVALLRIVHPEVEAFSYDVAGAVRFSGLLEKRPVSVSIAPTLVTDAVIAPDSILINSSVYSIRIKFESVSFLLDELFSALLLGRVKSIVRRKRAEGEEFANMIESIEIEPRR